MFQLDNFHAAKIYILFYICYFYYILLTYLTYIYNYSIYIHYIYRKYYFIVLYYQYFMLLSLFMLSCYLLLLLLLLYNYFSKLSGFYFVGKSGKYRIPIYQYFKDRFFVWFLWFADNE